MRLFVRVFAVLSADCRPTVRTAGRSMSWKGYVSAAAISSLLLTACGGGGGGSGDSQAGGSASNNQAVDGTWSGTDPISGLQLLGMVDQAGKFYFIRTDGVIYVGTVTASGASISGTFDGYSPVGAAFSDGSTYGTGSLSGTISQHASISALVQFTTADGTATSGNLSLTYPSGYDNPTSLSSISGNYTDQSSGDVISVTTDGEMSWQDPNTGCVGNGTVSLITPNQWGDNPYQVQFEYENCQGSYAALNGGQFTGFATINDFASPHQVTVGVTGQATGHPMYALSFKLNLD